MRIAPSPLAATLLAAGLLAGAGAQAADKVKVGFVSTLTGPSAALGVDIRDAFMLAVKLNGGKLGGLPAEVLVSDDQFKPDVAKQLFEKNIKRDRVDFMTGVVFSNILLAGVPEAFDSKTFYVSPNAAPSPLAGKECNPYFFAVSWPNDAYHEAMGQHATAKGYKNVYLLAPNPPSAASLFGSPYRHHRLEASAAASKRGGPDRAGRAVPAHDTARGRAAHAAGREG